MSSYMKESRGKEERSLHNRKVSYMRIDQHPSVQGLVSIMIAAATLVILLTLCIVSFIQHGKSGMWIGLLGILSGVISVVGIVFAAMGLSDPEARRERPVIGLCCNIVLLLILVALYTVGM